MAVRRKIGRREFLHRAMAEKDKEIDGLADKIESIEEKIQKMKAADAEYRDYVYDCIDKRIKRYGRYGS